MTEGRFIILSLVNGFQRHAEWFLNMALGAEQIGFRRIKFMPGGPFGLLVYERGQNT